MANWMKKGSEVNKGLFITVFADASHCPSTLAGGYAGWVKYGENGDTLRYAGEIHGLANSNLAEIAALIQTLKRMLEDLVPVTGKILVIQSDCTGALTYLKNLIYAKTDKELFPLLSARALTFKHVQGHKGYRDRRASVNTWCDKEARKCMERGRHKNHGKTA